MKKNNPIENEARRSFLTRLAVGTAALGVSAVAMPFSLHAANEPKENFNPDDVDELFKKLKGKHRMVFDVTQPHSILPFAWPRIFLVTNEMTGTPEKENNAIVVLRHDAIPFAMGDELWEKYKFGEAFNINDQRTNTKATRNPFWQPRAGEFKVPGIGEVAIGINELQSSGVLFCVCNMALSVHSAVMAAGMNKEAADVRKDFLAGLIPGVQVVPSGVWAVGRAQEHGCSYCFAG
ncbi:MAG: hypothetical protein NVSMB63_09200 [Sediminibacterium sp.]